MQQPVNNTIPKVRSEVGSDESHLLPINHARHIVQPLNLHHAHSQRLNHTKHPDPRRTSLHAAPLPHG